MRKTTHGQPQGFTLIELLVVMTIAAVLMLIGIPILRGTLLRAQMMTFATETQSTFQRARFEAIKRGLPVVVQLQPDDRKLRAYVDVPAFDLAGARTDTPLVLEPEIGLVSSETDHVLFEVPMAAVVVFAAPGAEGVVEGMTNISGGAPEDAALSERVLVFNANGSVLAQGAYRFAARGDSKNFLEARVEFAASGKTALRKFDCKDTTWRYRDEEVPGRSKAWEWYGRFSGAC